MVPPQSKEWGNYYNCASRACGALFASFFFAEVRSGRMSSYDPRGWGHLPKELFASSPSVKRGWLRPAWTATLGTFAFHLVLLPRLLTPHRVNPWVEWMLSFLWMLFGSLLGGYMPHQLCDWSTMTPAGGTAIVTGYYYCYVTCKWYIYSVLLLLWGYLVLLC